MSGIPQTAAAGDHASPRVGRYPTAADRWPLPLTDRILAALYLIIGSVLFWALFEQAGASLNLFTDRSVDRTIFGWEVPASMFQSLNSFYFVQTLLMPDFWLGNLTRKGPLCFCHTFRIASA